MPVKIRLARMGRSKIAKYRIVAADSRMKRDGRFLETVGFYDPQTNPKTFNYKNDRVAFWLKNGAQPTLTVKNLLRQDQFSVTMEGTEKGLTPEQMNIQRKPERKRKPKPKKEKK
ncbi:MAG: 30S ribosomal protein S16 [Chitinispirillaceae bacterium]|nr:30S ribosomal protein S16 [Chitinispirillaceae bacterium]